MIGVIILAAGIGQRMNLGYNKMLYKQNDIPLYKITLAKFLNFSEIVLVINESDLEYIDVPSNIKICIGGKERSDSVYNGLQNIQSEYVLIHDGARYLVSEDIINKCILATTKYDAFFVGVKVKDTIKERKNNTFITLPRDNLIITQTPQGGKTQLFKDVYEKGKGQVFFDDVSLVERYSDTVIGFVEGEYKNIKATTLEDLLCE